MNVKKQNTAWNGYVVAPLKDFRELLFESYAGNALGLKMILNIYCYTS